MKSRIVLNRVRCPDGTILISHHRRDYKEHTDENGIWSMIDGGNSYLKRGGKFEDISLYEDSPFDEIRENLCRGGRGKNGDEPLKWVKLKDMSNSWIESCVVYNKDRGLGDSIHTDMYRKEIIYRKYNNIFIED